MNRTDEHDWIVTVDAQRSLDTLVSELGQLGLLVSQILADAGVIVVHGTSQQANLAKRVTGVTDVSKDEPIDIGPPDAKVS
jgi:hypothetical protein